MEKFQGFLSYARKNAKAAPELIDAFSAKLGDILAARLLNAQFEVWRDIDEIRVGDDWRAELGEAIAQSHIFIAMLSPTWFSSKVCAEEYAAFLKVEERHGQKLIVPILIDGLGEQEQFLNAEQRGIHEELKKRQHKDIQQAAYFELTDDQRMTLLTRLSGDVLAMLTRLRKSTPTPATTTVRPVVSVSGDPKMIGRAKEKKALIAALLGTDSPVSGGSPT